jgi:hypothetical protein
MSAPGGGKSGEHDSRHGGGLYGTVPPHGQPRAHTAKYINASGPAHKRTLIGTIAVDSDCPVGLRRGRQADTLLRHRLVGAQNAQIRTASVLARIVPTAAHNGGYASDAIPGAVTSRDRVGRLRQFLMTASGAESVTASGGPMIMAGDNCQQPGRRLQVGRDRGHDGSRGERAWPLIMTWCPDKRAVNTSGGPEPPQVADADAWPPGKGHHGPDPARGFAVAGEVPGSPELLGECWDGLPAEDSVPAPACAAAHWALVTCPWVAVLPVRFAVAEIRSSGSFWTLTATAISPQAARDPLAAYFSRIEPEAAASGDPESADAYAAAAELLGHQHPAALTVAGRRSR